MGTSSPSSPLHTTQHRRTRSHSSASSLFSSPPPTHSSRQGSKRANPSQLSQYDYNRVSRDEDLHDSPSTARAFGIHDAFPEKWDVDLWRRGSKRARMGHKHTSPDSDMDISIVTPPDNSIFNTSTSGPSTVMNPFPSSSTFPSTSDAFGLRPKVSFHTQQLGSPICHKASRSYYDMQDQECLEYILDSGPTAPANNNTVVNEELANRHSEAFDNLRKSVTETGEGFVMRMREWEELRSKSGVKGNIARRQSTHKRGRRRQTAAATGVSTKRPSITSSPRMHAYAGADADGDYSDTDGVEIYTSESDLKRKRKKRAVSLGDMTDYIQTAPLNSERPHHQVAASYPDAIGPDNLILRDRCSSPFDTHSSSRSLYSSEEDSDDENRRSRPHSSFVPSRVAGISVVTPPLSFTFSESTNSSMISLPISSAYHDFAVHAPSLATRSERAVAALSLALANGAGSVDDYGALRAAQGDTALEEFQAGELWR